MEHLGIFLARFPLFYLIVFLPLLGRYWFGFDGKNVSFEFGFLLFGAYGAILYFVIAGICQAILAWKRARIRFVLLSDAIILVIVSVTLLIGGATASDIEPAADDHSTARDHPRGGFE